MAAGEPAEGDVEGRELAGDGEAVADEQGLEGGGGEGEEGGGGGGLLGAGEDDPHRAVVGVERRRRAVGRRRRAAGGAAGEELDGGAGGENLGAVEAEMIAQAWDVQPLRTQQGRCAN